MKLKDCFLGTPVINTESKAGHITGFCYNIMLENTKGMSDKEKYDRTIVTVKWVDGRETAIHPGNIDRL